MFSLHLPKFHLINGNMGQKQERMKFGIAEISTQKHLVPPYIQMFSLKRYLKPKEKNTAASANPNAIGRLHSPPPLRKALLSVKALQSTKLWGQLSPQPPPPPLRLPVAGRDLQDTSHITKMFLAVFTTFRSKWREICFIWSGCKRRKTLLGFLAGSWVGPDLSHHSVPRPLNIKPRS